MKYSFACPMGDGTVSVEAGNDDEAVVKLMAEGAKHAATAHPGMNMDEGQMKQMVRAQMTKS